MTNQAQPTAAFDTKSPPLRGLFIDGRETAPGDRPTLPIISPPYGLAAAVRTKDVARAHRLAEELEAGVVWINDHHRADVASPWGGVKDSGVGREGGQEAFDNYSQTKAVMVNKSSEPFDWFEPEMRDLRMN